MVWLEVEKDGEKRIAIDGYISSFQYLKEFIPTLRHKKTKLNPDGGIPIVGLNSWSGFYQYLRQKDISEEQLLRLFTKTVGALRKSFCSEKWVEERNIYQPIITPTTYRPILFLNNNKTLGRNILAFIKKLSPKEYEILINEYNHDLQHGHIGYIQNLILSPTEGEHLCGNLESLCCRNWIDKLNFRVKKKGEYKNYEAFRKAWLEILNSP